MANKIIVLENGAVVEIGDHAELMKKHGLYYELFTTQAKRYITPIDGMSAEDFIIGNENHDFPPMPERGERPPFDDRRPPHGDRKTPKDGRRPPIPMK